MSWDEANEHCKAQGKYLMEPMSYADHIPFLQLAMENIQLYQETGLGDVIFIGISKSSKVSDF